MSALKFEPTDQAHRWLIWQGKRVVGRITLEPDGCHLRTEEGFWSEGEIMAILEKMRELSAIHPFTAVPDNRTPGEKLTVGFIAGLLSRGMRDVNKDAHFFDEIKMEGNKVLVRWHHGPAIEITVTEPNPEQDGGTDALLALVPH